MEISVNKRVEEIGIVPVIKLTAPERDAAPLAKALCDGGVPVAEVTFRAEGADKAIALMKAACPDMLLGAGTVLTTEQVEQQALKRLLGITSETALILPTSPLTPLAPMLSESDYQAAMHSNNYGLHTLYIEEQMAQAALRMGQSDYLPDIALFGKQTLYAHGLPSNLLPRTIVGVGFTWNLFDGLHRERAIAQSRLERQSLAYTREHTEAALATTVSELYATLTRTLADTRVLTTTIALNEELARMRRIAFAEGMATSTEVVDAENALSQARLDLLSAYYLYRITLTNLQALCGII